MHRLALALSISLGLLIGGRVEAALRPTTATLTIRAVGGTQEFRTLGALPQAFSLRAGGKRTFSRLPPGRYVVVAAPPVPDRTMQVTCSDGVSNVDYQLDAGENLVCTYTSLPL